MAVDASLKPEAKASLIAWLETTNITAKARAWQEALDLGFQSAFGSEHFSGKCFARSVVASLSAFIVAALLYLWANPEALVVRRHAALAGAIISVLVATVAVTALPGFIALTETRMAVRYVVSSGHVLPVMVIDLAATFIIGWLIVVPFYAIIKVEHPDFGAFGKDILLLTDGRQTLALIENAPDGVVASLAPIEIQSRGEVIGRLPLGLWYYSVFASSVWLWVVIGAALTVRLALRVDALAAKIRRNFAYTDRPCVAIAALFSIVLSAGFIVLVIVTGTLP